MAFQQLRRGGGAAAPSAVVEVSDGLEPGQGPSSVYLAAEEALAALALGGGGHTLRTPQPPGRCGAQAQAVSSAVKARRKIRSPSPGTPASSRVHGRSGGGALARKAWNGPQTAAEIHWILSQSQVRRRIQEAQHITGAVLECGMPPIHPPAELLRGPKGPPRRSRTPLRLGGARSTALPLAPRTGQQWPPA